MQEDFPLSGGCGDVFMYAATADGSAAVVIEWDGVATAAWEEDGLEETATLPDDSVRVSFQAGRGLSTLFCNDVLEPGQGVQASTMAIAGTVEITVEPDADGFSPAATATVTLSDVVFEVDRGDEIETWRLDSLELRDVAVGWFAG